MDGFLRLMETLNKIRRPAANRKSKARVSHEEVMRLVEPCLVVLVASAVTRGRVLFYRLSVMRG